MTMLRHRALAVLTASFLVLPRSAVGESGAEESCPAGGCAAASEELWMPRVVVGCWQLLERSSDRRAAVEALLSYARAGFTAYDTADIYGPSESILGAFNKAWSAEAPAGAAPLQFFTKYVTDSPSAAEAKRVNSQSLRNLQVERLHMVQFHWWSLSKDGSDRGFLRAAQELVRLQGEGLIQHLAGCNMDTTNLKLLVDDGVPIRANQVQYSLLDRRPEVRLLQYCKEQGIKLAAFGVVGGGLLSESFLGLSRAAARSKLDSVSRRMYWSSLERWSTDWAVFQELLQVLQTVGRRRSPALPIAAVACAWALQRMAELGAGGSLILGIRGVGHLEEHVALLHGEVALTPADLAEIQAALDKGKPPEGDVWYQERGWA